MWSRRVRTGSAKVCQVDPPTCPTNSSPERTGSMRQRLRTRAPSGSTNQAYSPGASGSASVSPAGLTLPTSSRCAAATDDRETGTTSGAGGAGGSSGSGSAICSTTGGCGATNVPDVTTAPTSWRTANSGPRNASGACTRTRWPPRGPTSDRNRATTQPAQITR